MNRTGAMMIADTFVVGIAYGYQLALARVDDLGRLDAAA